MSPPLLTKTDALKSWLNLTRSIDQIPRCKRARFSYFMESLLFEALLPVWLRSKGMQWGDRIGRRIKLRDLHVLHAVVQSGSMTKAAGALAISVPVVSKAIAELERTIGVPLLDRSPQGVEPTAYGRALLRRGLAAFDELRQGVKDIEFLSDPTIGEVRIASTAPL